MGSSSTVAYASEHQRLQESASDWLRRKLMRANACLLSDVLLTLLFCSCGGEVGVPSSSVPASRPSFDGECDLAKPFEAPVDVLGLEVPNQAYQDWGQCTLSPDELTIYFQADDEARRWVSIYRAARPSRESDFSNVQELVSLRATGARFYEAPSVSADGLTLYFIERQNGGTPTLRRATRSTTKEEFRPDVGPVPGFDGDETITSPFLSRDGSRLYFDSGQYYEHKSRALLYRRSWTGAVWGNQETIYSYGGAGVETDDQLTLFFSKDAYPEPVASVWMSTRSSVGSAFGPPSRVAELADEYTRTMPSWISPNGCRLYVYQDYHRGPGGTLDRIRVAQRPKLRR